MIYRGRSITLHGQPASDPMLAAQGWTREDERRYNDYCVEAERDEEDRVRSGGLLECPECGERSVAASRRWTAQYGGGYDTAYECANPECDYAEVCV